MPLHSPPKPLPAKDPFFGLRILQPNEDPSLPPKRILNYKDGTELVYIPPGPFWMGDGKAADRPRHEVTLDGFYMAVYPVTNKQYRRFMHETGHRAPDGHWSERRGGKKVWEGSRLLPGYEEHPVVCVDWADSSAYGAWAKLRLPTEAEWEKAACGPLNRAYPWGDKWENELSRHDFNRRGDLTVEGGYRRVDTTVEVKAFLRGISGYGCEQMSGNVWEWCEDWYDNAYYRSSPLANPRGPEMGSMRVNRGGSWLVTPERQLVAYREKDEPSWRNANLGFRLARSFP